MAAPTEVLTHGSISTPILSREELTLRDDGFDEGYLTYFTDSSSTFTRGDDAPNSTGMTIREIRAARLPADDYEITLRVQGILNAERKRVSQSFSEKIDALDDGTESWLARYNAPPRTIGLQHETFRNMVCTSIDRELMPFGSPQWAKWNVRFMGSLSAKPYKRKITCDEATFSAENITVNLPGGWLAPTAKGQVALPRVVIEDSYVSLAQPSLMPLPGNEVPPNAPEVKYLGISNQSNLTRHWPNGWKLAAINWEPIAGTTIGIETRRYEYVHEWTW